MERADQRSAEELGADIAMRTLLRIFNDHECCRGATGVGFVPRDHQFTRAVMQQNGERIEHIGEGAACAGHTKSGRDLDAFSGAGGRRWLQRCIK